LRVVKSVLAQGAAVRAYDPQVSRVRVAGAVECCRSIEDAVTGVDAAVITTAWPEFAEADWTRLCQVMRRPIVVDGRGLLRGIARPTQMVYRPVGTRAHGSCAAGRPQGA
jgi:UDPglucose 6-dehydrogenase